MRFAVFAAGAVGGYLGGRLAQAGEDVTFIARGANLRAIRERGLRVDSAAGDFVVQPARATDAPAEVGPVDCVLVAVKTWQLPSAAKAMGPLVGPETFVVPLLNGVEAPEVLAQVLGREHVLGGLCRLFAELIGPGRVKHSGFEPTIEFGELDGTPSARTERLLDAFGRAQGVTASIPEDVNVALWQKFLFVTPVGGVGAVTRVPVGVLRTVPETRAMLEAAMREIRELAVARGVEVPKDAVDGAMAFADGLMPSGLASMQRDIMNGRPSELEGQTGAVVRLGREAAVPVPVHDFLYAALLPQERLARAEVEVPDRS